MGRGRGGARHDRAPTPRGQRRPTGAATVLPVADRSAALAAVSEALLGIAGDLRSDAVLERLVEAARGPGRAPATPRSACPTRRATGSAAGSRPGSPTRRSTPSDRSPAPTACSAPRCTTRRRSAARTCAATHRFGGWWPAAHPDLDAFLAVPIVFRGDVVAAFYLANKDGGFTRRRRAPGRRAGRPRRGPHRARPPLRGQPGAVGARGAQPAGPRAARRLTQSLFGLRLRLEAGDVPGAGSLLEEIFAELRSLILQLRPPALELDGLVPSLAKHLDVVGRTHGLATRLDAAALGDLAPDVEQALFRIAQEAVTNVVRHAGAPRVVVRLDRADGDRSCSRSTTTGVGFDPGGRAISARRLGLVSMRERAAELGGTLAIESSPGARHDRPRRGAGGDRRPTPIRVVVVDDHPVVREGLRSFLGSRDGIEVVGEAGDVDGAVAAAASGCPRRRAARPRAARAAAGSPPSPACSRSTPRRAVIVLTSFGGDDQALAAVRAGASGWLGKDVPPAELEAAIRTVHRGGSVLDPAIAARVLAEVSSPGGGDAGLDQLTAREQEVLALLGQGLSNRDLAARLFVAEKTVKTHVSAILAKLHLTDRTQAALFAVHHGLVDEAWPRGPRTCGPRDKRPSGRWRRRRGSVPFGA